MAAAAAYIRGLPLSWEPRVHGNKAAKIARRNNLHSAASFALTHARNNLFFFYPIFFYLEAVMAGIRQGRLRIILQQMASAGDRKQQRQQKEKRATLQVCLQVGPRGTRMDSCAANHSERFCQFSGNEEKEKTAVCYSHHVDAGH